MTLDVLVAEIGSTTTVVNAFDGIGSEEPRFVGQGQAPTSVSSGDVCLGLNEAVASLQARLGADRLDYRELFATSSAAGGLRMTVHGLVYEMTARAAREAALGAGANIHLATAGRLRESELEAVERIAPNLILLAGGTDYGDRETALDNARQLCRLSSKPPVIYAGNLQNREEIQALFHEAGIRCYVTENVYPRLDELNIEPTRAIIHRVFEEHITQAPGMARVREMVGGPILPTPGAVMESALRLYRLIGDLVVVDVGGATTDIHSVTDGSEEVAAIQTSPEPRAKRSVEGDLGVYVNAGTLARQIGLERLEQETGLNVAEALSRHQPIPATPEQVTLTERLTWYAASIALTRHAGRLRYTYGPSGRQTHAEGKDLTKVRYLVATGGALTRLPGRGDIMEQLRGLNAANTMLYPRAGQLCCLEDRDYVMASLGVLSLRYPDAADRLLKKSLGLPK